MASYKALILSLSYVTCNEKNPNLIYVPFTVDDKKGQQQGQTMRLSSPTETTVHDPDTLEIAYQKWIKKEMDKRLLDYSDIRRVVIKCANWNVSAHSLEDASLCDLRKWLLPMESAGIGEAPDIYAVGLQEVIDLNVRNTFFNNTARTEVTAKCVHILSQVLNELEYYKVTLLSLPYNL